MADLGRLERVKLRDVWADEAGQFTPWLAEEQNIKLLGETLGLDLEVQSTEKEVGPFRADILCRETTTPDHWVLIENQLEKTDHAHLGQLLTYAAGLDAVTIIWIAQQFTDEHRAVFDWLNEITDSNINFFGLEIELWRIAGSPVAPKFNIVCNPNEWTKTVRPELTETRRLQLVYWRAFKEYVKDNTTVHCGKPQPDSWMNHPIEGAGFYLTSVASTWDSEAKTYTGEIRVEMQISRSDADEMLARLEAERAQIEGEFGEPLKWCVPEGRGRHRIYARAPADIKDREKWGEQHAWLRQRLETFHRVFLRRIKNLILEAGQNETAE